MIRNASNLDVARLGENRFRFPDVGLTSYPKRQYPSRGTAAHALGEVGEISTEELGLRRFHGYDAGRRVGKAGIERGLEASLAGLLGIRT